MIGADVAVRLVEGNGGIFAGRDAGLLLIHGFASAGAIFPLITPRLQEASSAVQQ